MDEQLKRMTEDIQNRIQQLAFTMWEAAGRQHGMAMDYWLEAEREVLRTMQQAADTLTAPRDDSKTATSRGERSSRGSKKSD